MSDMIANQSSFSLPETRRFRGADTAMRWVRHVVALHCDPKEGSAYWLDRMREGTFPSPDAIMTWKDLEAIRPMDAAALAERPIEDFVPRRFHDIRYQWITGETGGTLGVPCTAVFLEHEFDAAFVEPFRRAAALIGFPRGLNWLWIGPSGPHIIGKAARACARVMDSADPFAVDFDPRWIKKFAPATLGFSRYFDHVIEQAMRILSSQSIGVLFSTPPVLERLGMLLDASARAMVRGLHLGGMPIDTELKAALHRRFPHAVLMAGYGNTLLGMLPEIGGSTGGHLDYFPWGNRLHFHCQSTEDPSPRRDHSREAPGPPVAPGQLCCSRFDEGFLLVNLRERDCAEPIEPNARMRALGFNRPGIRNPQPVRFQTERIQNVAGLY